MQPGAGLGEYEVRKRNAEFRIGRGKPIRSRGARAPQRFFLTVLDFTTSLASPSYTSSAFRPRSYRSISGVSFSDSREGGW